ncbi:hypothetical protein ES708_00298 [subsurface metagenome]
MAKVKLTNKTLEGNPLGEAILQIQDLTKRLTSLSKKLEGCFVSSLETSQPIIDPFIARALLSNLESDPLTLQYFDAETLSRLKSYVTSECKIVANSFEVRFRPFCEKINISFEGRFPTYVLAGFLQVSVEQAKGICRVGDKTTKSLMLESIAPTILDDLKSEAERPFEISVFLKELYEAYDRVINLKGINVGQPAQILDVFSELILVKQSPTFKKTPIKSHFQDYTRELFSRDLAKVSAAGPRVVNGNRLELMSTAFPDRDGIPIRRGESVRFAGRIVFTEVVP